MTPRLRAEAASAVQVVTLDGRQLSAGRACLYVLQEIGWHPWLARIGQLPPFIWAVELGYRLVARNRPLFARVLFTREAPFEEDQPVEST